MTPPATTDVGDVTADARDGTGGSTRKVALKDIVPESNSISYNPDVTTSNETTHIPFMSDAETPVTKVSVFVRPSKLDI